MLSARELGHWGEELACAYLQSHGYHIVGRNYHCPHGEIDVIAEVDEQLVFCEVKTRRSMDKGEPEEALTLKKLEKITRAVSAYLADRGDDRSEIPMRIDLIVVRITEEDRVFSIGHLENVGALHG